MIGQAWVYFVMAMEEVHLVVNLLATSACFMALSKVFFSLVKIDREIRNIDSSQKSRRVAARRTFENAKKATVALKGALFATILFTGGMIHWVYSGLPKIVSSQQSTMWGLAVIAVMLVLYQLGGIFLDMFRSEDRTREPGGDDECSG